MADSSSRLTNDILRKAISRHLGANEKDVAVEALEVAAGSKLGDNFATDVKSIDVKASVEGRPARDLNYIAKLAPTDVREQLLDPIIFKREVGFYERIAGDMRKLRKEANLPGSRFADAYFASAEKGVILFENLKNVGFEVPPKSCKGLDSDPFERVVVALAEFHATAYHFLQTRGVEKFLEEEPDFKFKSFYEMAGDMTDPYFGTIFQNMGGILKTSTDRPGLADKLAAQPKVWKGKATDAVEPNPGDFLTLIHGDIWYNNVLFKFKEDGTVDDLVLIDFQLTNVCNPGVDLAYLFCSSTFPADRRIHLDRWLRLYQSAVARNLVAFGYPEDTYPLEQVKKDYKRAGYHGFTMSLMHLTVLLAEPGSEVGKMMDMSNEDYKGLTPEQMLERMGDLNEALTRAAKEVPFFLDRLIGIAEIAEEEGLI